MFILSAGQPQLSKPPCTEYKHKWGSQSCSILSILSYPHIGDHIGLYACIYIYTSSCRHLYADIDLFSHLLSWYALAWWIDLSETALSVFWIWSLERWHRNTSICKCHFLKWPGKCSKEETRVVFHLNFAGWVFLPFDMWSYGEFPWNSRCKFEDLPTCWHQRRFVVGRIVVN